MNKNKLILFFPLLLILLYKQRILSLNIYNPKWWQFITHSFVHLNMTHLLSNIIFYIIIASIIIILNIDIIKIFITTIISLPIINSIIIIFTYPIFFQTIKTSQGSSGIISAMIGFLPMIWAYKISKKHNKNIMNTNLVAITILYIALVMSFTYIRGYITILVAIAFILSLIPYRNNLKYMKQDITPLTFFIIIPLLFPLKIIHNNIMIESFIHYTSIIYGTIISYVFLKIKTNKFINM